MPELPDNSIGFDTETLGLRWARGETAFLGTWADESKEYVGALVGERAEDGRSRFLRALHDADCLVAHNLKFDAHQTRATLGEDIFALGCELHDSDLMSRVLMPEGQRKDRGGHGLKNLAEVFLRADAKDAEDKIKEIAKDVLGRKSLKEGGAYYDVWRAYPDAMEQYALLDARYTLDLAALFLPQFDDDARLWDLYNLEREVQRVLYYAEARGVRVDPEAVTRLDNEYASRKQDAEKHCKKHLGFIPEGEGNEEKLRDALIKAGVELTEETPTGELATNAKALARFKGTPAVDALFEYRRVMKFISTYIAPMKDVEVVHPDFQQAEAWTGRMSCRNPNMQNLPKRSDKNDETEMRMRSMFIPREDHYFVVADYKSIEPRILAWYLGVPAYREEVDQDRNYESACHAAWPKDIDGKPTTPDDFAKGGRLHFLRPVGKLIYLSIIYGGGGGVIRNNINQNAPAEWHVDLDWVKDPTNKYDTPPEASAIKKKVMASIPGFGTWNSGLRGRVEGKIKSEGFVRTLLGRKQIVDPDKKYVGLNALIQGSAADIMKKAAVELDKLEHGQPLLFVHDEVVMEYPKSYPQEKALAEVVAAMEGCYDLNPPLRVDASVTEVSYAHA